MAEERKAIKVNIFGSEYSIRGEADESYIQSLAAYLDERMKEIAQSTHLTSPLKISILAGINLADEIFRLREHSQGVGGKTSRALADESHLAKSIAPEAIAALARHIQSALEQE
ncbi:cell division protein ZapA [bacterium]|nr:cell division protein ZapA [bacterium]